MTDLRHYDVIVSEPPNPWVSGVSSLFTEEFYHLVTRYLHNDGIFIQWVHLYHINPEIIASIFSTLHLHFPHLKLLQIKQIVYFIAGLFFFHNYLCLTDKHSN